MHKKLLIGLLVASMALTATLGFTACDFGGGNNGGNNGGNTGSGSDQTQTAPAKPNLPKNPVASTEGLSHRLSSDGTYYTVTGIGTCTAKEIVIGNVYNNLPVTGIAKNAFENHKYVQYKDFTKVTISEGITSIGEVAFGGCKELTEITIPNSLTSIGMEAFADCVGLTSITIPDSVTSIGLWAFERCSGLTSVTIGNGVTCIENGLFIDCSKLMGVTIGNSVTSIVLQAFSHCSGLTSITIPNSVTSIGDLAFYDCSGLTAIRFGGTKAQWKAVKKGSAWDHNTGAYTVICSDGKLDKDGNDIS